MSCLSPATSQRLSHIWKMKRSSPSRHFLDMPPPTTMPEI